MGSVCSSSSNTNSESKGKGSKGKRRKSVAKDDFSGVVVGSKKKKAKGPKKAQAKNSPKTFKVSLPSPDSRQLETKENETRLHVVSLEQKQFSMRVSDFRQQLDLLQQKAAREQEAHQVFEDDDEFSDDDSGRKCSMRVEEQTAANQIGSRQTPSNSPRHLNKNLGNPHSRASVKKHNNEDDCWVIIRGKIYDVSKFIDDHPGGAWMIVKNAGEDATQEFEEAHEMHIWKYLEQYYVADVV